MAGKLSGSTLRRTRVREIGGERERLEIVISKKAVDEKMSKKETLREILEKYSRWLEDAGYLDDDWWCEEPKAVDRYLFERKKFIKSAAYEAGEKKGKRI